MTLHLPLCFANSRVKELDVAMQELLKEIDAKKYWLLLEHIVVSPSFHDITHQCSHFSNSKSNSNPS